MFKEKIAAIKSDVKTNPEYPVSADTERILALAIELAEDDAGREAIRRSHADWLKLRESHMQYLGRGIDRFQGTYTGSSFLVGTQTGGGVITIQKSTDSRGHAYYGDRPPQ